MKFSLGLPAGSGNVAIQQLQEQWQSYTRRWNTQAVKQARGVWHASSIWVQLEATLLLVQSTVQTLVIVVASAFLSMLLFTRNMAVSLYVVATTLCILAFLAFFIIVVMRWPIGPFEIIALIVFLGYAVTYSLHIAHKYSSRSALVDAEFSTTQAVRRVRVTFAVRVMGGAAMGSAATTIGCSVFLLSCTLTIFQKLGGVVLVVTVMSLFMSLGPLCAWLLIVGPKLVDARRRRWTVASSMSRLRF